MNCLFFLQFDCENCLVAMEADMVIAVLAMVRVKTPSPLAVSEFLGCR